MNKHPNFWTENPDKLELLLIFRNQALSCGQIGKRLECTRNSVIGKLARLGLPSLYHGRGTPDRQTYHPPKPKPLHRIAPVKHTGRGEANSKPSAPILPLNNEVRLARPHSGHGKTILKLGVAQCRFPVGFNRKGIHIFCAQPTIKGSWCEHHTARVFKGSLSLAD